MMSYTVNVSVNSGLSNQLELAGNNTIQSLRQRFYAMTGFTQESMKIKVNGVLVENELQTLADLAGNTNVINIELSGRSEFGDLNDVSKVEKFEITDEDYDQRKGTFREWKRQHGIAVKGEVKSPNDSPPEGVEIGNRCEVELADKSHNRGVVRFIGKTEGSKGYWIGVELDEPFGTNNGSLKGKKYFECDDNFGVFLRAARVKVGDYPPIDWEAELADEM
ncbi:CAP-Gly domain containing protein [Tritrichomonas foetus]|uniref:CAP-Gly domain containing protein n=1 Tax=Tritrichomonas foetus TaxID=1144522 RepID=A0A1J4KM40_9EUKA|nr:CAP-Gly domain containing protein [Tritrichomonas foetus]|eukprot:OHT10437.1 CAP-Gly domain containing protein [Tritrichomonas foetus]